MSMKDLNDRVHPNQLKHYILHPAKEEIEGGNHYKQDLKYLKYLKYKYKTLKYIKINKGPAQ